MTDEDEDKWAIPDALRIYITDVDLSKFIQEVYLRSEPKGLGCLSFTTEKLSPEEVKNFIDDLNESQTESLHLDYIKGRACKMTFYKSHKGVFIYNDWYDHSSLDLLELLHSFGIKVRMSVTQMRTM